jgi:hypothetical protein
MAPNDKYKAAVLSVVLYECETWSFKKNADSCPRKYVEEYVEMPIEAEKNSTTSSVISGLTLHET